MKADPHSVNLLNRPYTINVSSSSKRISGQTLDSVTTISIWTIIQSVIIVCLYYLIMRGEDTVVDGSTQTSCFVSSEHFHSQKRCSLYLKLGLSEIVINLIIVSFLVFFARGSSVLFYQISLVLEFLKEVSVSFWYIYEDYEDDL